MLLYTLIDATLSQHVGPTKTALKHCSNVTWPSKCWTHKVHVLHTANVMLMYAISFWVALYNDIEPFGFPLNTFVVVA